MGIEKREGAKGRAPALARSKPSPPRSAPPIAVAIRRQTPEEQRRFNAAFDVFLAEMVRRYFDRSDKS